MIFEPNETIISRLKRLAVDASDRPFCTFISGKAREQITFRELYDRSAAYAEEYRRLGVMPEDVVIVMLKHSPHLYYAYLGAILAGAIPSFMPFPTPKQRLDMYWADHAKLFERLAPRLIVSYAENIDTARAELPGFSIATLIAADAIVRERPFARAVETVSDPDSVACLQHSSGTTGLKKGVMLTHRAVLEQIEVYGASIGLTADDCIVSWLPLYHDMGFIACFMTAALTGMHLVALDPFEWVMRPTILLDEIERYNGTLSWLPNFAFSHIVNRTKPAERWDLSSVRAFINCSEPCKPATFERFAERFSSSGVTREKLQVCYAMAENVFGVTQTPIGKKPRVVAVDNEAFTRGFAMPPREGSIPVELLSCGVPIDGVQVEIRNAEGLSVPDGDVGEIHITGPFLFDGYYKQPEKTAERLRDGWYASGDVGFMDRGELVVTGRRDDLLILNGRNYYAHEIEAIANGVSGIVPGRVVAVSVEDERSDATVVVLILECETGVDAAAVSRSVRELILESLGLSVHAVRVVAPGGLVKTTSGKISRNKNRELYMQGLFR